MKKLLIALFIFVFANCVYAQDSLYDTSNEAKLEYNQGVDYFKAGQYDRSMAAFRRTIQLDPNYIDAYYNLGSILEYLRQDSQALDIFKQLMVRKPDDYESVYKAAAISKRLGQTENAKKYLSLIPPESSVYSKAQSLASGMNTNIQTIKNEIAKAAEIENSQKSSSNGLYSNLPSPTGIAGDSYGNIYVACFSDNMIYKITPENKRIIFVKDSRINGPIAMVSDDRNNLYVSNYNGNNVIKITPAGNISVLIPNIQKPYGMSVYNGMLFVSSQGSNSVLKYKL